MLLNPNNALSLEYYFKGELQTSLGNKRNYSNGNANAAVENLRDKLVEAGY